MVRNAKGQFPKGVSGNPKGRKPREAEKDYLVLFRASVSPDDWKEIIAKAILDAKRGDGMARKFIADYLLGLPIQRIEHTGDNGDPIRIEIVYADNTLIPTAAP